MLAPRDELKAGERLGRYRLVRELGRGSMGLVFLAEDTLLRQSLCLKVLHPALSAHPEAVERFHREIVLARRIAHRGVCRLHDIHEEHGVRFITMEYVEGTPLRDLLGSGKPPLSVGRALRLVRSICDALAAAHDVGVIHRDLKPRNVIVKDNDEVMLLDFGIATALDFGSSSLTMPGVAIGTRHYISPEVWAGRPATPKSDQFAVGVVLYNCLTDRMPFGANDVGLVEEVRKGPPVRPSVVRPEISAAVDAATLRALAFRPEDRFDDVRALARALEEAERSPAGPAIALGAGASSVQSAALARTQPVRVDEVSDPSTQQPAPRPITLGSSAPSMEETFVRREADRFDVDLRKTEPVMQPLITPGAGDATDPSGAPITISDPTLITVTPGRLPLAQTQPVTQPVPAPRAHSADDTHDGDGPAFTPLRGIDMPATLPGTNGDEGSASKRARPLLIAAAVFATACMVVVGVVVVSSDTGDDDAASIAHVDATQPKNARTEPRPNANPSANPNANANASADSDRGRTPEEARVVDAPSLASPPTPPAPTEIEAAPTAPAATVATAPPDAPREIERVRTKRDVVKRDVAKRDVREVREEYEPHKQEYTDALAALGRELVDKGVRVGDDAEIDRLRASAASDARDKRHADAVKSIVAARERTRSLSIDRAFVERKLRRFNDAFDRVSDASLRAQLDESGGKVLVEMRASRYATANKILNDALSAIEKAR